METLFAKLTSIQAIEKQVHDTMNYFYFPPPLFPENMTNNTCNPVYFYVNY